jgi:hypothetical protein
MRTGFFLFFEILKRNEQHSEAFAIAFSDVLVVHFVCSSNAFRVNIIGISKEFKTLVNENIVYDEIR